MRTAQSDGVAVREGEGLVSLERDGRTFRVTTTKGEIRAKHVLACDGAGSKTRKVVLYCSGPACDASARGAQMLVDGGFKTVLQYEGGLDAWNEAKRTRQARAARAV